MKIQYNTIMCIVGTTMRPGGGLVVVEEKEEQEEEVVGVVVVDSVDGLLEPFGCVTQ